MSRKSKWLTRHRTLCPLLGHSSWMSSAPAASQSPPSSHMRKPSSSVPAAQQCYANLPEARRDWLRAAHSEESRLVFSLHFIRHTIFQQPGCHGFYGYGFAISSWELRRLFKHQSITQRIEDGSRQKSSQQKGVWVSGYLAWQLFFSYFVSIRDCKKQDLHRWIAEKADSHEYLESLDGFPGCEDVDCLLRIATYPCAGGELGLCFTKQCFHKCCPNLWLMNMINI